jgi:hypothetical protein
LSGSHLHPAAPPGVGADPYLPDGLGERTASDLPAPQNDSAPPGFWNDLTTVGVEEKLN